MAFGGVVRPQSSAALKEHSAQHRCGYHAAPVQRKTISIPEPLLAILERLAVEKGVSLGELVRRALDEYIQSLRK